MEKFNSYDFGLVCCYNSIICALDIERQKPQAKEIQLIEGYETALQTLSDIHYTKIIDNIEFCRIADLLHICTDCPITHVVPCVDLVVNYLT